jgi:hypothetical protein
MRELITIKGTQRACLYGLGVLGLLGPSPPAKSKSAYTLLTTHYMAHAALASNKFLVQCINNAIFRTVVSSVYRKKKLVLPANKNITSHSHFYNAHTNSTLLSDGEQKSVFLKLEVYETNI